MIVKLCIRPRDGLNTRCTPRGGSGHKAYMAYGGHNVGATEEGSMHKTVPNWKDVCGDRHPLEERDK